LKESLKELEEETKKYETELAEVNKEAAELEESEQKYWEKISELESRLLETEEENGKVKSALTHFNQEYQRLAGINVISDNFKITCPERVAAINGFRLGKLQTEDVKWDEINVALGQVAALLAVLSAKLGFEDSKYKIIPRGCFSKIKTKSGKLHLYMANNEAEFNRALEALLEYVKDFSSYIGVLVGSAGDDQKIPRPPQYLFSREG
jgi:DNA repair exonuclease SbcCD ATPase subunit